MDTLNIILSLFNFAILILFLIYWLTLQKSSEDRFKEKEKIRLKVDKILEKAHEKGDVIIGNAKKISSDLQKSADKSFKTTVEKINKENEKYYKTTTETLEKNIQNFSTKLQNESAKELKNYGDKIRSDINLKTSTLESQINSITDSFAKDLESFKESEKERVKSNIQQRLDYIVKELIPENISVTDHERLVEDAIIKADKEGLFK